MNKFNILLIIISVLLTATILLQQRGGGMSSAFGGAEVYHTRRGIEKSIFIASIVLSVLFVASALARLFFN